MTKYKKERRKVGISKMPKITLVDRLSGRSAIAMNGSRNARSNRYGMKVDRSGCHPPFVISRSTFARKNGKINVMNRKIKRLTLLMYFMFASHILN